MGISRVDNKWKVDIRPNGSEGRRLRRVFETKGEAIRYEKYINAQAFANKDWNESKPDKRTLNELIEIWYKLSGYQLKDGLRRKNQMLYTSEGLRNPRASKLNSRCFLDYRAWRSDLGISGKTLNNELCYLNSMYNGLRSVGEVAYPNPLSELKMIRLDEIELSWLTAEQIKHLLKTIEGFSENPHVLLLTKICLATGARWGEAESLNLQRVQNQKITFSKTKSGKIRSVPISDELYCEIVDHLTENKNFSSSIGAFRRALAKSKIELPKGQAAHVLRHSFASHFMMKGGNILTLQKILGHSTINMTMRYAHLASDHLLDAIRYNPLNTGKFLK